MDGEVAATHTWEDHVREFADGAKGGTRMRMAAQSVRRSAAVARSAAVMGVVGVGVMVLWGGCAGAAGTGGSYGSLSESGATPPGAFNVLTSKTVPKAGGTVTVTHNGQKVTVVVPATDFSTTVVVSIWVPSTLASISGAVSSFGVTFTIGSSPVSGTFPKPVAMTITASAIKAGDVVEEWNGSAWVVYTSSTVSGGTAKITMTSDPAFAVETAATTSSVTATSASTGIPVLGVTLGSGTLIAGGAVSLLFARRRRRVATRP